MKKILFIPTYAYLSSPIFNNVLEKLSAHKTIYLDVEDQYNSEKTSKVFKNQFHKTIPISLPIRNKTYIDNIIRIFMMMKYQSKLKKIIKLEVPSAIITTSDLTFTMRIIRKYFSSIPVFIIQPALFAHIKAPRTTAHKIAYVLFNKLMGLPLVSRQSYFGKEFDNVFLLLWGEYFQNMFQENQNIHIVGDLTLDHFPIKKNQEAKNELLIKEGFPLDTKIITICTNAFNGLVGSEVEDNLYKIYKDMIREKSDILFIIKPHPRNKGKEFKNTFYSLTVNNIIISDAHLHDLFQYTDIHISSFSRTAMEALAGGIPFLSVNPDNEIMLEDFFDNAMDEKVTCLSEMMDKIEIILNDSSGFVSLRKQYIEKMFYKLDGKSSVRAAAIIENELKKNG